MSHGPALKWATDLGLALGLVGALIVVAAIEPRPTPPAPPAELSIAAASPSTDNEIPPLPPLELSFASAVADKELPPLPPPPPPPPPPPREELPLPFQDKVDSKKLISVGFTRLGTYGLVRMGPTEKEDKRLTFEQHGRTNQSAVMIDGNVVLPFFHPEHGRVVKDLVTEGKIEAITSDKLKGDKKEEANLLTSDGPYIIQWEAGGVRFEQRVEYEAGLVSRKIDTLRIRYTLTNVDTRPRKAGMRLMVDTFIGSNDEVPFFVPGQKNVIDKPTAFTVKAKNIPEYILALERNDLSDPTMTVVQIGLAQGPPAERPDAVILSQWPGDRSAASRNPDNPFAAVQWLFFRWDYPLAKSFDKDSALSLVYLPTTIAPGKQRVFEYTYGLGSLAGANPELSLYPYGPFVPGKPFRLSAFVKNAKPGQTVTLALPPGFALDQGEPETKPVELQSGVEVTKVDWLVTPAAEFGGKAELQATLTGAANPAKQTIFVPNPWPALQPVVVTGKPVAGGVVRVTTAVFNAKADTTVTLALPPGATFEAGSTATQPTTSGSVAQATWLVRLPPDAKGNLPVTVKMANPDASAAGVIAIPPTVPTLVDVKVDGLLQAGGKLRIIAQIADADASGSVEVKLPKGVVLVGDEKASKPTPAGRQKQVFWIARVDAGRVGPANFTVRLLPNGAASSKQVELVPATPVLSFQLAKAAPAAPSKPFWVVARVQNPGDATKATLTLPGGFAFAGGSIAEIVMEKKTTADVTYTQAAWLVRLDSYTESQVELKVSVPGVGTQSIEVKCERGSVIR